MSIIFLRRDWNRNPNLGKGRKKKQVWRKPKGRDNKMREKRRGYPSVVSQGHGKDKSQKGKIIGKKPIVVYNEKDLDRIVAYCQKDTLTVAQLFRRYQGKPLIREDQVVFV